MNANYGNTLRSPTSAQPQTPHFTFLFEKKKNTTTGFVYATVVLGHVAGLSEKACLYAGADWLSSLVNQRLVSGQLQRVYDALCYNQNDMDLMAPPTLCPLAVFIAREVSATDRKSLGSSGLSFFGIGMKVDRF